MYHNGQIVWDIERQRPVRVGDGSDSQWAWAGLPGTSTHFLKRNERWEVLPKVPEFAGPLPQRLSINGHEYRYSDYHREQEYSVALPSSVEEALALMKAGAIFPAPRGVT